MSSKVDIVVPVYEKSIPKDFGNFVDTIARNTKNYRLILASSDKTQPKNINDGLALCQNDFAAILDWDVYVPPRWLHILVKNLEQNPKIGIIGSKMVGNYYGLNRQAPMGVTAPWPTLAGGLMVFRNAGLSWDESFPSGYWADNDFCRQYKELGYLVAINGDIEAQHDIYTTQTTDNSKLTEEGEKIYRKKWGNVDF